MTWSISAWEDLYSRTLYDLPLLTQRIGNLLADMRGRGRRRGSAPRAKHRPKYTTCTRGLRFGGGISSIVASRVVNSRHYCAHFGHRIVDANLVRYLQSVCQQMPTIEGQGLLLDELYRERKSNESKAGFKPQFCPRELPKSSARTILTEGPLQASLKQPVELRLMRERCSYSLELMTESRRT